MKIAKLIILFVLLTTTSFARNKKLDEVSVEMKPSKRTEADFKLYIQSKVIISDMRVKKYYSDTINYLESKRNNDSIKIKLKSGTEWYLHHPPPHPFLLVPRLLFNTSDSACINRFNYFEILSRFYNDPMSSHQLIEFISFSTSQKNLIRIEDMTIIWYIKPNNENKLVLTNKVIK